MSEINNQALLDESEAQSKRIAELEANLVALAAENAGLNKFIAQSCYVFADEQDEISDAYICATDGGMPQTPVTDAFLADVLAVEFNELCAAWGRTQMMQAAPDGLVKAVRFYEQVKCENPPAETGAWKDAIDWVLKEACQAVNIGTKGE